MGFFGSSAQVNLQPVNPPLGVFPHFCVQQPTTLVLKEKAFTFSGDDFAVKDQNGIPVVRCQGKAFSFADRKVITDPNGRVLFNLRNKLIAIHKTFIAEDDTGREIFRVKKRMAMGTKMQATFINHSTGRETTIDLRGDFWGGSGDLMVEGGPVIAQITRKMMNMREVFTDNQTYFVTVAPGVDLALMAAICICFDEAKNENN